MRAGGAFPGFNRGRSLVLFSRGVVCYQSTGRRPEANWMNCRRGRSSWAWPGKSEAPSDRRPAVGPPRSGKRDAVRVTSHAKDFPEHAQDAECSCGEHHSHVRVQLAQTFIGLVFIIDSFVIERLPGI